MLRFIFLPRSFPCWSSMSHASTMTISTRCLNKKSSKIWARCSNYRRGLRIADCASQTPPGRTPLWGPGSIFNNWQTLWFHSAFYFPRKILGLRPTDQSCHHETWFQDFVNWRNTRSQHGEHDRRIFLKERPVPPHQGAIKGGSVVL